MVGVLQDQDADVEGDDDEVDEDEMHHGGPVCARHEPPVAAQDLVRLVDVQHRDDDLLDEEDGQPDPLKDEIRHLVLRRAWRVAEKQQHRSGHQQPDGIDNDHDENATNQPFARQDDVQPRVQHE